MNRNAVRGVLLEEPNRSKIIRLDDGREFRVEGVERWMDIDTHLAVAVGPHTVVRFPYRKIASIEDAPPRRRARKKRSG